MGVLLKLQNGDTKLKSLKFGSDQPGNGSSNQPFIQKDIDDNPSNISTPDFLLRGGIDAPQRALDDTTRISKFLTTPEGINFILKQNILSRTSVKPDGSKKINGGLYKVGSLISQTSLGFLGNHSQNTNIPPYISATHNNLISIYDNKQIKLIDTDKPIEEYRGGPDSKSGIGKTKIKFATDNTGLNPERTGLNNVNYGTNPKEYLTLNSKYSSLYDANNQNEIKNISISASSFPISAFASSSYDNVKQPTFIESTTGSFSSPDTKVSLPSYDNVLNLSESYARKTSSSLGNDKTLSRVYYSTDLSDFKESNSIDQEDYIPFRMSIIGGQTMNFRAYLDEISDSYTSGWTGQNYMGRAEKFYKYTEFGRDISFSFTIAAENQNHLDTMYKQLNQLASSLAPKYQNGYMAANLHKLTIGDYLTEQYGIIQGLTYNITTETPWGIDEKYRVPYYIKVSSVKFTPIHQYRPEYGGNFRPIAK